MFFDFGGTLASLDEELEHPWKVWSRVARESGWALQDSAIRAVNDEADRRFHERMYDFLGRTREYWRIRDAWVMEKLGITEGGPAFLDTLQGVFEDPSKVHLYPETVAVLREIRSRGLYVGVISNFTDGLLDLLEYHGLRPHLDSVTFSQEAGVAKPDRRIFSRALERAGCTAQQAVHVGDSWESDYLGAQRVGIVPVLVNRKARPVPAPCSQIPDLRALDSLIGGRS